MHSLSDENRELLQTFKSDATFDGIDGKLATEAFERWSSFVSVVFNPPANRVSYRVLLEIKQIKM